MSAAAAAEAAADPGGSTPFLPDPLLLLIFSHLNSTDLRYGISLTCRRFRELVADRTSSAWRAFQLDFRRAIASCVTA